ncbi:MAG: fibronectin type III domain-containing protein [Planctomycetota bacterium]|jgi:hypothetical protein
MSGTRKSNLLGKITVLFVICCCCLPAHAKYGGGTGETNDPYLIYTPEQMNAIGADPCDWDKHFLLMADIDLGQFTAEQFNIIGYFATYSHNKPFTGVFDGNGHIISNFSYTSRRTINIGVFGYVRGDNAEIKDLGLIDPNVDAGTSRRVGSLLGWLHNGIISNCYVDGGSVAAYEDVGGLVGRNDGTITNSYSSGSVSGNERVGGLVGMNESEMGGAGTITNCYSTGSVSGKYWVGGLVGLNSSGSISNCYSIGDVNGEYYIAGLVGRNLRASVSNCSFSGNVSGDSDVGGLVGHNVFGTITNCSAAGSVLGYGNWNSDSVGGLVGHDYEGTIANCYSTGSVSGNHRVGGLVGHDEGTITNCYSTGDVLGYTVVGGLVGYNEGTRTITNCCSKGDVTGNDVVGGLVGLNRYGTISNCYADGGSVTGDWRVGGLVGDNYRGTITNCYSKGGVSGNENVGGLVGFNTWCDNLYCYEGDVWASFWDIQTSGQATSAGGTGLPTYYMKKAGIFTDAGWDFDTPVWIIDEGYDYPRLLWELTPVLHTEPEITLGTTNTISWGSVVGRVEYYAECAADANFNTIVYNTGWITETSYEFTGLQLGKRYFYSVKARNIAAVESQWSNVENSLQCTLYDAVESMLGPENMKNKNMKSSLLNKIDEALQMIDGGLYKNALNKLENDILQKTNGCAQTGGPDNNDWIITCEQQRQVYPLIIETIEHARSLMP